jgi:DNA repair protein RecN (Recombination protein N)
MNMLKELRIKNLAIIGDLTVGFARGMNVLTGETGAGKSIIVDALGLALGDRAHSEMIRSGEKEASVQAYFELDEDVPFPDIGLDISEDLVLRRTLSASGKSRAFVNDNVITLQTLADIGKSLVDIHSQHEHQSLLKTEAQRKMLDAYGKLGRELDTFSALYGEVQSLRTALDDLKGRRKERAHRLDLLRYQIREIDAASLKTEEKELLLEEKHILANLSKLRELAETIYSLLYTSDNACASQLSAALSRMRELYIIDPGVEETLHNLESALPLVEDAAIALRGYRGRYEADPDRLEVVEDRLELIGKLEKKYGMDCGGILNFRQRAEGELHELESSDETFVSLEEELRIKEATLLRTAQHLSEKRKKTAFKIKSLIISCLKDLSFGNPSFEVDIRQEKDDGGTYRMDSSGMDHVEFLFSANLGEPLKSLSRIISGGELSRVMLALKNILAEVDNLPVLIFDEVDAGIGGRTAESVGKKLRSIAGRHQLICITHLPQIASLADYHLKVEKTDKDSRVTVAVRAIEGRERLDEISRMLSGTSTETSLKHAEELLGREK